MLAVDKWQVGERVQIAPEGTDRVQATVQALQHGQDPLDPHAWTILSLFLVPSKVDDP